MDVITMAMAAGVVVSRLERAGLEVDFRYTPGRGWWVTVADPGRNAYAVSGGVQQSFYAATVDCLRNYLSVRFPRGS